MNDRLDPATVCRLLDAATGASWALDASDPLHPVVCVSLASGGTQVLRVKRDAAEAASDDVAFIADCRTDAETLLAALASGIDPEAGLLLAIADRIERASPAPWEAFLEQGGGMGGCTFIRVGGMDDAEPDLYLWLDGALAPDPDHELVAVLRSQLPRLLSAVLSMRGGSSEWPATGRSSDG